MQAWILGLGFGPSLVLASLSSLLIALGAPPAGWIPGHWLGFVPLLLLARRPQVSGREALLLGLVGGLGIGLVGFSWIAELLVRFAGMPRPLGIIGLGLFAFWMSIPYALWALGLRFGPGRGWASFVWPAAHFVSLQFSWPNVFPYTPLIGFAEAPAFMQLAELGGVPLLEALVIVWAVAAAGFMMYAGWRTRLGNGAAVLLIPTLMFGYGSARMAALDAQAEGGPSLRVGIVQPNIPVGGMSASERLHRLRTPSAELAGRGVEFIVWPEAGTFPYRVARPFPGDRALGQGRVMAQHRVPTFLGAGSIAPNARYGYNSAYLLDPAGAVVGRYDKVNLVPLGESVPLVDPDWLTQRIPGIAHLEAGSGPVRFVLESPGKVTGLGPLICYEDIIPGFVRRVAGLPGGVELFVNATIDAWYGDTAEPWEHLALAQFRSVEHRVPLVRSTSTGVSAVVDYNGRRVAHLPLRPVEAATAEFYPPETLVADVLLPRNTADSPTPYARWGWLFPYVCLVGVVAASLRGFFRGRKTGPS